LKITKASILLGLGLIFLAPNLNPVQGADAERFVVKGIHTHQRVVALTFDDGPNGKFTPQILHILQNENVKATFFLLAKNAKIRPRLTQKIAILGHDIGNHSFNHKNFGKMTPTDIRSSIKESQRTFYGILDKFPIYFRPPYGLVKRRDYPFLSTYFHKAIKWSIDTQDWRKSATEEHILKRIFDYVKPGHIILFHDNNALTVSALPKVISKLREKGYRFVTISEMLKIKRDKMNSPLKMSLH
jgi:peptidoglycan-N-acetylglucosamine deacetylase